MTMDVQNKRDLIHILTMTGLGASLGIWLAMASHIPYYPMLSNALFVALLFVTFALIIITPTPPVGFWMTMALLLPAVVVSFLVGLAFTYVSDRLAALMTATLTFGLAAVLTVWWSRRPTARVGRDAQ